MRGGGDTDTVAAIAGSLAGAVHGGSAVPLAGSAGCTAGPASTPTSSPGSPASPPATARSNARGAASDYSGPKILEGSASNSQHFERTEQLALLVAEVRLHDRADAIEVPAEDRAGLARLQRVIKLGQQMADHAVILLELRDHGTKLRMPRLQFGEQPGVLTDMVRAEGDAEAVAVEQQIAGHGLRVGFEAGTRDLQRAAQTLVRGAKLGVPRDESRPLAVAHSPTLGTAKPMSTAISSPGALSTLLPNRSPRHRSTVCDAHAASCG